MALPPGDEPPRGGSRVVVAMLDQKRERGIVYGFRGNATSFELFTPEDAARELGRKIEMLSCKAVYFVKSLDGNRKYQENKLTLPTIHRQGRKIEVIFGDGERIVGTTEGFNPTRQGFTLYPPDPASNNIEIFVVTANIEEARLGATGSSPEQTYKPPTQRGMFLPGKRVEAVLRVLKGEPLELVAKEISVPPQTLAHWKNLYQAAGPGALGAVGSGP